MTPKEETVLGIIQSDIAGIHMEFKTLNGRMVKAENHVYDHHDEIYGNDEKQIKGMKKDLQEVHDLRVGAKAIGWFIGLIGLANLGTLVMLWQHIGS